MDSSNENLRQAAQQAAEKAYAPYSQFKVGAAMLLQDGRVVTGCNVENVSFGLSNCAERTAIYRAIADGVELKQVKALAIYTPTDEIHSPCGACRQVMAEFFDPEMSGQSFNKTGIKEWTLATLLPDSFNF